MQVTSEVTKNGPAGYKRKIADAVLAAAKFVPSSDGKNVMRKFVVHGKGVTEYISAEKAADAVNNKK